MTVAALGVGQPADGLDPEAVRRVRRRVATAASKAAARHGGTMAGVDPGESLVAVFGLPTVHEDDALRAVRALVELRAQEIPLRAGLETGEIVVSGGPAEAELLTTSVAEGASRLRDAAQANEIVLGASTRRLVRDAVRLQPAQSGWRVLELVPESQLAAQSHEPRIVGRKHELVQLRESLRRAARDRAVHLVTVVGVAGIGKSRLARELVSILRGEATVLTGRCLSYGEGITFWPLREIVEEAAGGVSRESVLELLSGADDAVPVADSLAAALGTAETGETSEEEISWAVRRLLETLAHERSLVVVLEDLHWAEPTLLDLVEYLAVETRDAPLVLVCLARPELLEERPRWEAACPTPPRSA